MLGFIGPLGAWDIIKILGLEDDLLKTSEYKPVNGPGNYSVDPKAEVLMPAQ